MKLSKLNEQLLDDFALYLWNSMSHAIPIKTFYAQNVIIAAGCNPKFHCSFTIYNNYAVVECLCCSGVVTISGKTTIDKTLSKWFKKYRKNLAPKCPCKC